MKLKFLFKYLFLLICFKGYTQNFSITPYAKALTNIKEGYFEGGIEYDTNNFHLKGYARLPLTDKDQNLLVLDRFTDTWRGIFSVNWRKDLTKINSSAQTIIVGAQFEWGTSQFRYYPTGNKNNELKSTKASAAGELKFSYYYGAENSGNQRNLQLRLRYESNAKASKEVGVVMPANNVDVVTTSNMVISPPTKIPIFSPAFAYQHYRGGGSLSYTHAFYYNMSGGKNQNNPFNDVSRLRYEFWVFYYPIIANSPNVKLGIGPYVSFRIKGSDDFNKIEYGGQIAVKLGSLFQNFF